MKAARTTKSNARPFYRKHSAEELREALRKMYLIRRFEEGAEEAYMRGLIHGTMHLSIGQERLLSAPPWRSATRTTSPRRIAAMAIASAREPIPS